jgi:hypothetical protein
MKGSTAPVGAESAGKDEPAPLVAVTRTRIADPASSRASSHPPVASAWWSCRRVKHS